jgi:ATP synthase I chain
MPSGTILASSDEFYARALDRIPRIMFVLGLAALITVYIFFGWRISAGFGFGGVISFVNFYWLKRVVIDLGEISAQSGNPVSGRGIVQRFLLRYFLMAVVAFVILTVSRESLYGLFAGLSLPVAAILCEAVYEAYRAFSN